MKNVGYMMVIAAAVLLWACGGNCEASKQEHCRDTVPNEACLAHFQSWFYNSTTNQCEQKSYSGCKAYGFPTQAECESCKCH